jgi:hypothetical protein
MQHADDHDQMQSTIYWYWYWYWCLVSGVHDTIASTMQGSVNMHASLYYDYDYGMMLLCYASTILISIIIVSVVIMHKHKLRRTSTLQEVLYNYENENRIQKCKVEMFNVSCF